MNQHRKKYLIISCASAMVVAGCFLVFGCNRVVVPVTSIPSGWTAYTDPHSGLTFDYPNNWTPNSAGSYTYFTINDVDVLDISSQAASGSLQQIAQSEVVANGCPALDQDGQPIDRVINSSPSGVLFVLSCSATTNSYNYLIYNASGSVVDLSFHDAFPSDTPANQTPSTFQNLLTSVHQ